MTINIRKSHMIKAVELVLLVAIFALLLWSQPWSNNNSKETRKITVTGESVIKAEPDEFTFSPYFELKGSDQEALKAELTKKANEAVDAIKNLGVDDKDIKLDASSYERWYYKADEEGVLNIYLEIAVSDSELVQKVQDYLLTTVAKGQLTPRATFSESKQNELDNQAVDQAIDDAKTKAELQAKKFDARLGKVLEVSQQQDSIFPIAYDSIEISAESRDVSASLPVLSGQNEYRQSVTVTYELR